LNCLVVVVNGVLFVVVVISVVVVNLTSIVVIVIVTIPIVNAIVDFVVVIEENDVFDVCTIMRLLKSSSSFSLLF
jgi:hypothetical protein